MGTGAVRAPATGVQRGIWLTHLLEPASPAYHIALVYRLTGPLDVAALDRAYATVCDRHESLRSSFVTEGRRLYQEIWPQVHPALRTLNSAAGAEAATGLVEREVDLPFDIAAAPLLRVSLIRRGEGEHLLVIVAHHLVADADTVAMVSDELSQAYTAAVTGSPEPPGPAGAPYREHLLAAEAWLGSKRHQAAVAFYRRRLDGFPPALDLPTAPGPAPSTWDGALETRVLDAEATRALTELARRLQVTPFVLMLTVYGAVLHLHSGQDRIAIGTPVSLRDEPGLAGVAGMLVNSVPIPTHWRDEQTFADAVRDTGDAVLDCLDHRRCPFDQLVADLHPPRVGRRNPIFQVMFGYSDHESPVPSLHGLTVTRVPTPARAAKLELTLTVVQSAGVTRFELEWNAGRVDPALAGHLADALVHVATAVARDPDVTLTKLRARASVPARVPAAVPAAVPALAPPS